MCVAEFHEAIVSVVSYTATDRFIIAYSLDLNPIWECKIQFCNGAARDRGLRKVQQGEFSSFTLKGMEGVTGGEVYLDKSGKAIGPAVTTPPAGQARPSILSMEEDDPLQLVNGEKLDGDE
ncbi:hypothetical protein HDU98_001891 [Podochytrium sp. JEL0797]|nr:hypothetical protein HDU98_001891 [Podochytrium sp. JEL0797]